MSNQSTPLKVGQLLPDLVLLDDQNNEVSLRKLQGSRVVLYFYPKDDTLGCTTQACAIRDNWSEFEAVPDLIIYGVSRDDSAKHQCFRAKYNLPFNLLVDDELKLANAFGFWVEKSTFGKKYMGMERSTVIVDSDGTIKAILRKVRPTKHVELLRKELGL